MSDHGVGQRDAGYRFFWGVTAYPKTILAGCMIVILWLMSFIPTLVKDTRSEAYIPQNHPSVVDRDRVKEIFGLRDPLIVAVEKHGPHGVFTPQTLAVIRELTEQIEKIPGVDPDHVKSLSTEQDVYGTADGMNVRKFFTDVPRTQAEADAVRLAVMDFPLYVGSLVSRNGDVTAIVAELLPDANGEQVYDAALALTTTAKKSGERFHVAGEAAVSGYLSKYMDRDREIVLPLNILLTAIVLLIAYRTGLGLMLPALITLGAIAAAIGGNAIGGYPVYVVTIAVPSILIAVSVGDVLHILGEYYEGHARNPKLSARHLVCEIMSEMWQPVVLTRMTDVVGFIALAATSSMPPMKTFGYFSALGVFAAMIFTMLMIPTVLVLVKLRPSPALRMSRSRHGSSDVAARLMTAIGNAVIARPKVVIAIGVVVTLVGLQGSLLLTLNESRIENFHHTERLYRANQAINAALDGTTNLDILIEADRQEALLEPANLRKIEALQDYAMQLDHVRGSTSIVDFLKQLNRAMNEDKPSEHVLPQRADLAAQYLLLYSGGSDPRALADVIDYDRRRTNLRLVIDSGLYTDERPIVDSLEEYVRTSFNGPSMTARITGGATVDYHWVGGIGSSYWQGIVASLLGVYLMVALRHRSGIAGLCAVIPVSLSILITNAVMGYFGIWLGVGTAMSADIAIGVGVDFGIHTIERLNHLVNKGYDMKGAMERLFPSTGRALLFMFAALVLGSAPLLLSAVPAAARFGALFIGALIVTFVSSFTLLPAILQVFQPRFLYGGGEASAPGSSGLRAASLVVLLGLLVSGVAYADVRGYSAVARAPLGAAAPTRPAVAPAAPAPAASAPVAAVPSDPSAWPAGIEIARRINARDEGSRVSRTVNIELIDRSGATRSRMTKGFRKNFGAERRLVLFYESPANLKGTAFLTRDYPEPGRDDDQWLYLPAAGKVRRLGTTDRGAYFLETDLTYEDLARDNKVGIDDYNWKTVGFEQFDGRPCYVVELTPIDEATAKELGYGKLVSRVDSQIWIIRKTDYFDTRGAPLKTLHVTDVRQIQGIWTALNLDVENLKTGHRTIFNISDVDYQASMQDDFFEQRTLPRGLR